MQIKVKDQELEKRNAILQFEDELSGFDDAFFGDSDNCPLKHSFADGCYIREILIPKGTIVVGKIHKHCHPSFILKGDVSVFTEDEGVQRIKAPLSFVSEAGVKRVVYAHEDCTWITVHMNPSNTQNLKEIEDFVIAKNFDDLELTNEEVKKIKGEIL